MIVKQEATRDLTLSHFIRLVSDDGRSVDEVKNINVDKNRKSSVFGALLFRPKFHIYLNLLMAQKFNLYFYGNGSYERFLEEILPKPSPEHSTLRVRFPWGLKVFLV